MDEDDCSNLCRGGSVDTADTGGSDTGSVDTGDDDTGSDDTGSDDTGGDHTGGDDTSRGTGDDPETITGEPKGSVGACGCASSAEPRPSLYFFLSSFLLTRRSRR